MQIGERLVKIETLLPGIDEKLNKLICNQEQMTKELGEIRVQTTRTNGRVGVVEEAIKDHASRLNVVEKAQASDKHEREMSGVIPSKIKALLKAAAFAAIGALGSAAAQWWSARMMK